MKLVKSEAKIQQLFSNYFPEDLSAWLMEEIALNRQNPVPLSQREFWNPPHDPGSHDPRGCPSYVQKYVLPSLGRDLRFVPGKKKPHCPHPNIIDALRSKVVSLLPDEEFDDCGEACDGAELAGVGVGANVDDDDDNITPSDEESTETDGSSQSLPGDRPRNAETKRLIHR